MFTRTESLKSYIKHYPVTFVVVLLCFFLFGTMTLNGSSTSTSTLLRFGAMYAPSVQEGEWYRFLTANFLHIGWMHLAMNLLFLYVFAPFIEIRLGKSRYILFFVTSGIASMILPFLFSDSVTAGVSGVLYAMMGMYVYLLKKEPHWFTSADKQTVLAVLLISTIFSFLQPDISITGHLGGFLFGLISSQLFLLLRKK